MLRHFPPSSVSALRLAWGLLLALQLGGCSEDQQGGTSSHGEPLPAEDADADGDTTAPEDADGPVPDADVREPDGTPLPPDTEEEVGDVDATGEPDVDPPPAPLLPNTGTPATLTPSAADARSPRFQLRSTLRPVAAGGAASPRFQIRHTTLVPRPD